MCRESAFGGAGSRGESARTSHWIGSRAAAQTDDAMKGINRLPARGRRLRLKPKPIEN